MAFPPIDPTFSDETSVNAIAEAEAGLAQCMAAFYCSISDTIKDDATLTPKEKIDLIKQLLSGYSCKEKAMGKLVKALANKILADKGLVPGGDQSKDCPC